MHRRLRALSLAFSIALTLPTASWAQATPEPAPRTWFQLQGVAATWKMRTAGNQGYANTVPFDAETDLGLPKHGPVPGLLFGRRIGERWRIEVDYSRGERSGSTLLAADRDIDSVRYAAGTRLDSTISLATLRITGGWSALMTPEAEAGVLIGGQSVRIGRQLSGQGQSVSVSPPPPGLSPQPPQPIASHTRDYELMPVAGVYGKVQLAPAWHLAGRLSFSDRGNVNAQVTGQWRLNRHLALGLGYQHQRQNIDSVTCFIVCSSRVLLDTRIQGPMAMVEAAF